ncbi:MAG: hypothetical protein WC608_02375 [Parcubacteria group bacterium]
MKKVIPTVKVWCLPEGLSEDQLLILHQGIVKVLAGFMETGVKDEGDMLNLFPRDLMTYGLGSEIKVEITDLPQKCDERSRYFIAREVGIFVGKIFSAANIFCTANCVDPEAGIWSFRKE